MELHEVGEMCVQVPSLFRGFNDFTLNQKSGRGSMKVPNVQLMGFRRSSVY